MELLDAASDTITRDEGRHHYVAENNDDNTSRDLELDYLRAIAAGVSAIAFLLLRTDEQMSNAWDRY